MNVYLSASLFALIVIIYLVITELFTILFRIVGLPEEKARFQVISLLTGCGFTTRESELFISTRSRRRIARSIMLFGYVFNITVITALINVFLSMKTFQEQAFMGVFVPIAIVALVFIVIRIPFIRSRLDSFLMRIAGRVINRDDSNSVVIIGHIGGDSVAQVILKNIPDELAGKTLAQMDLRTAGSILVMLVEHKKTGTAPAVADTVFLSGDTLTVFGNYKDICRIFNAKEQFGDE